MDADSLLHIFPNLSGTAFRITSEHSVNYNCIAWAAGRTDRWWWPDPIGRGYWPDGVARVATVESFVQAFAALGYRPTNTEELRTGIEKIAIYSIGDLPTHAARQLASGQWTSKLGKSVDIEHELHALTGNRYGKTPPG